MYNRNREYLCEKRAESLSFRMEPLGIGRGIVLPLVTKENPLCRIRLIYPSNRRNIKYED